MATKLYVVHGSHPCATIEKVLQLKGMPYKKVEWPPPTHVVAQRLLFGGRTVPAIRFDDGEKVVGSRAITARIEERVAEPALLPDDPAERAAVLAAEEWGDDVLQPLARRVVWPTLKENAKASPTFTKGSKLPLPAPAIRLSMPLIARIEMRINDATVETRAADLAALPAHLDKIDAWIADGTMGAKPTPNRADLQIGSSLGLLMTMADLRALIAPRPAGQLADELFAIAGSIPAGALSL
ncbi:MAG TPA: glutathione S-transferase family protein [Solirubrobacteraceae bacterium]